MKLSERKIDPRMKEEGAWVENIPEWQDLKLKVRGSGNKAWSRLESKLITAVPRKRRMNGLDPEDRERINGILLRDTSLLDWSGIDGEDGKPEVFSKELANKYLTQPEYEAFRQAAFWAASVVAEQGVMEIEEDAGN